MRRFANIYPLSRLVHAFPPDWQALLQRIEDGKEKAFSHYLPAREAIVRYCAKGGRDRDRIVAEMRVRAGQIGGTRADILLRDNEAAFQMFESAFYPKIAKFSRSLLREPQPGVRFEELLLLGSPHMEVIDHRGRTRHIYLCCGSRKDPDLKAYLQLLSVIVRKQYGGSTDSVWCLDLRTGEEFKWKPGPRMEARCRRTANLYDRFIKTMES